MNATRLVVLTLAMLVVGSLVLAQTKGTKPAPAAKPAAAGKKVGPSSADTQPTGDLKADRAKAAKLQQQGNYAEAYVLYSGLATNPQDGVTEVASDLSAAVQCLQQLTRIDEFDGLIEKVIAAHGDNRLLLQRAAHLYLDTEHNGFMIAGEFLRGGHRGGGKAVNSFERDRVRALQLMVQAMGAKRGVARGERDPGPDDDRVAAGSFYWDFAEILMGRRFGYQSWRLQYLSDLSTLPDYDDGFWGWGWGPWGGRGRGGGWGGDSMGRGAPVDEKGEPVFYYVPKSWEQARNDGERWRWCLMQTAELAPSRTDEVRKHFADFLLDQFGVQTMAQWGWFFRRDDDDGRKNESGTYELHTLTDDETIARLATGIRRFKLPEEFNFIAIYKDLYARNNVASGEQLAQIWENRRQYPKAAEQWQVLIRKFGAGNEKYRQKRLDQIVGNWGMFEPINTQPAGQGASVEYRFRNGRKVSFEAYELDVEKLLADVKAFIDSKPKQLDWEKLDISNIGWRIVEKNQDRYIVKKVADWDLDLKPLADHFDRRITVTTPLQKAGAYLLVGNMEGGNTSRIVMWVADLAIVKKSLDKGDFFFVADAVSGEPVEKAKLEFFGYRQEWVNEKNNAGGRYVIHVKTLTDLLTDADGQYIRQMDNEPDVQQYQWIVTARKDDRLAYIGWTNFWHGNYHDSQYNATKTYIITDRPVYRPQQPVKFKFWMNHAQYDQDGKSAFAGRQFTVQVNDPKGQKLFEKQFKADDYGGFDGELMLAKDATLGVYSIFIPHGPGGGSTFRVEEYKKPEFEVKIDAPSEPVMLGEKITAKVTARYYFGAPVVNAKVKYKVQRYTHEARWYPLAYWDWFYGPGYWWYAYDYNWYPGWGEWGCPRPRPWWIPWNPQPPELVAEVEGPIGPDGTMQVPIDTSLAKAMFGDVDHRYEITAEVTDQSRRTIVGQGQVLVARKPFKVYAWVGRGHYRVGDVIDASFCAQTLDNKPVAGKGDLRLLKIAYEKDKQTGRLKPVETEVQKWALPTSDQGRSSIQIKADKAGQYRLSYTVADAKGHAIEGGYVFVIVGEGFDGSQFRFNDIELVTDRKEYKPDEKVKLLVNTNRVGSTVLLFVRPTDGVYLKPRVLRLKGKSDLQEIEVVKKDMPNFFVEGLTVAGGKVYTDVREVVVPPEKRVLDVKVEVAPVGGGASTRPAPVSPMDAITLPADKPASANAPSGSAEPSAPTFKPGSKAVVKVKLTDPTGEPYSGSTVVAMYDKAVEYISGGSNVPDIREFFWKWRRSHHAYTQTSLDRPTANLLKSKETPMGFLGIFGQSVADEVARNTEQFAAQPGAQGGARQMRREVAGDAMPPSPVATAAPMAKAAGGPMLEAAGAADAAGGGGGGQGAATVEPTVRKEFADTALWVGLLQTNERGEAQIELTMPENLTTWKTRVWAMGMGTKCGEGSAEAITTKNLLVRLQAPRFFVQTDEVVISANVHNYLASKKNAKVVLELDGGTLEFARETFKAGRVKADGTQEVEPILLPANAQQTVEIDANGEKRVDWLVKVVQPGEAKIRVKALTDEESDAMEMTFPVLIHGMLKTDSFSAVIRPGKDSAAININVPKERIAAQSRLEVRYSPTLAGAMVDALPYMVDYPYGCTEQTLNRFIPTVITQKILINMGLDLKDIRDKRTNLNAQEIGKDKERAEDWKYRGGYMSRHTAQLKEPVFDESEVDRMVKAGLARLASMQCDDGGWGWFSGFGERSYPHTTAVVVHGLQIARANDVALPAGMLDRGIEWLKRYQQKELEHLKDYERTGGSKGKAHADNLDAFVYMVLVDEKIDNKEMRERIYKDRLSLSVYGMSMLGIACHKVSDAEKRDMIIRNIEQYLVQDDENQTAYLKFGEGWCWWCWYGSEYEAQAYYLKLLSATKHDMEVASRLVKYLINNRKHATYWNSTRDTAYVIEAFADYMKAAGEDKPDMTVELRLDGRKVKEVRIDKTNLFSFDNKLVLEGNEVTDGKHTVEVIRKGTGPVYLNAYLTNFTLEDFIAKAGLEIKVERRFFRLERDKDAARPVEGARGAAVLQKVEKYKRIPLENLAQLASGDLVEIELIIESKNDYEYIMFEDMKAAGFEPVSLRSGYGDNEMGAYMELRDERVTFFVRQLARGQHSISYRMRAEIPGKFSALPTRASAMYAPELRANSDEFKVKIAD